METKAQTNPKRENTTPVLFGLTLFEQGNFEEAIYYFSKALKLNPDDALARKNLEMALAKQGKLKEAIPGS